MMLQRNIKHRDPFTSRLGPGIKRLSVDCDLPGDVAEKIYRMLLHISKMQFGLPPPPGGLELVAMVPRKQNSARRCYPGVTPHLAISTSQARRSRQVSVMVEENGAPDRIRTCDLCLRRAALYPAELRVPGRAS